MPSDDYAAVGGGALRIKGAKVQKKKKKKKDTSDLEKNLAAGEGGSLVSKAAEDRPQDAEDRPKDAAQDDRDEDGAPAVKTESQRRHEEAKKKRLLQMTQASGARPELLKTHKERVEELNTYLSKLSEHHDMPKIGPG